MEYMDIDTWERKEHFKYFLDFEMPEFSVCAEVNVSKFYEVIKRYGYPFYSSMGYVVCMACNDIKEFRYRIRDEKTVVCYDVIHPSFTVITDNNLLSFTKVCRFDSNFKEYSRQTEKHMRAAKEKVNIKDDGAENVIHITTLPWISFTGLNHAVKCNKLFSIPRASWGKFYKREGKMLMTLQMHVNHGLADGYHMGLYYERVQFYLDNFESVING